MFDFIFPRFKFSEFMLAIATFIIFYFQINLYSLPKWTPS